MNKSCSLIVAGPLKRFERYLKLFTDRVEVSDDTKLIAILQEGRRRNAEVKAKRDAEAAAEKPVPVMKLGSKSGKRGRAKRHLVPLSSPNGSYLQ